MYDYQSLVTWKREVGVANTISHNRLPDKKFPRGANRLGNAFASTVRVQREACAEVGGYRSRSFAARRLGRVQGAVIQSANDDEGRRGRDDKKGFQEQDKVYYRCWLYVFVCR